MQQPNPWLLFVGGIALLQISSMAWALKAPPGVRYAATGLCIALGLLAMGLGLARYFKKKGPPRPTVRAGGRPPVAMARAEQVRERSAQAPTASVRPRPGAASKDA